MWNFEPPNRFDPPLGDMDRRQSTGPIRLKRSDQMRMALQERLAHIAVRFTPVSDSNRQFTCPYGSPPPQPRTEYGIDPATGERGEVLWELRDLVKLTRATRPGAYPFVSHSMGWRHSTWGQVFLRVVADTWTLASRPSADRQFDPDVQLAVDAFADSGLVHALGFQMTHGGGVPVNAYGQLDPMVANLGNAYFQLLQPAVNHLSLGHKQQRHRAQIDKSVAELRNYFRSLEKQHPNAHIWRLELLNHEHAPYNPSSSFRQMADSTATLLRDVRKQFAGAVAGDVRKIDHSDHGRFGGYLTHLLLAVDGPSANEQAGMLRQLEELWHKTFPNCGSVVNCDDIDYFAFRGTGANIRSFETLRGKLDKACVFLAGTDHMVRVGHGPSGDSLVIGKSSTR